MIVLLKIKQFVSTNRENVNKFLFWGFIFVISYLVGIFIPEGFDWQVNYSVGKSHSIWTPWLAKMPF